MKRFVNSKNIQKLVLLSSLLAALIRIWTLGNGRDDNGLFARKPLAWTLLWLLTAATAAAIIFAVRELKNPGTYLKNYPRGWFQGLAATPAALCFLVSGYTQLRDSVGGMIPETTVVDMVVGIFGLLAGLSLLLGAVHRCMGRKPFFLINGLVCLYLAVRLFNRCQIWSNQPQMSLVVFPLLASVTMMLSSYQRVRFDVDLGNRRFAAFYSLMSVYFCVVAMFSMEQPLFYGMCALWQLTDLCSMRPLKRKLPVWTCEEVCTEDEPKTPEAE